MLEMPLFPLHMVLFPGTPLRLHIFEDRYKRMVNLCMRHKQPFGVVLIKRGAEALGPVAEPYLIGTSAQIVQVQRLPDERLNISAVGGQRFRVISLRKDVEPYLIGYVEPYPLQGREALSLSKAGTKLLGWVSLYLGALATAGAGQVDIDQFPEDPVSLAYQSAAMIQMSNLQKQELLSIQDANELIEQMNGLYRRELALLKATLGKGSSTSGSFSNN